MTLSPVADRVQIRPPRTADAEQLGVLNRQLGYATELGELVSRINKLSALREHFVAVAEVDGTVVGWVQAEHRFTMESGDKAELVGLIVGAATRRSGVGRLLVQAAEDWASAAYSPLLCAPTQYGRSHTLSTGTSGIRSQRHNRCMRSPCNANLAPKRRFLSNALRSALRSPTARHNRDIGQYAK
jgi:GNAT superfamily N-acetyltransferase